MGPLSGRGGSSSPTINMQEGVRFNPNFKIHVILDHYSDYFAMTGNKGEHHEALHHTLKTMDRDRNLHMKRNHGGVVHQKKSHQSISIRNALSAGCTPKAKLRVR